MTDPEPQSELAQAASWLERVTRDPLADAVPGRVTLVSVSDPAGRGRYQECTVTMTAEAPGVPATDVVQRVVFPRRSWPVVGAVLRARVSVSQPTALEVDWERRG